jgi:hypothetical protein
MRSFTSRRFREMFAELPQDIQARAIRAYQLFRANPSHPGLHFKIVDEGERIYSVRIGLGYRALGRMADRDIIWFWIGTHAEYDRLL